MNKSIEALDESRKKTRKRDMLIVIMAVCLMLALVIAYTIPMMRNPMRRPNPMPTNYVLNLTPLGTHIDDVISIVENHRDWRIVMINRERGFSHPQLRYTPEIRNEGGHIIGDKSIRVDPGYYRFGLLTRTVVTIFYGFDADGYLVDVFVWRSSAS